MLTEIQKKERLTGLGGSDIAPILGLSPYRTAVEVYQSKLGLEEEKEMTEWQMIGHWVEEGVLNRWFNQKYGEFKKNFPTIRHSSYPFMLANIDGFWDQEKTILEFKNVGGFKDSMKWGEAGSDDVPVYYALQVAHYMEVMNVDNAKIIALFGGNLIEEFNLVRDEGMLAGLGPELIRKEKEFWEINVENCLPPEPQTRADCKILFPNARQFSRKEANHAITVEVRDYMTKYEKLKELKQEVEDHKTAIIKYLQEAEILTIGNSDVLTYKNTNSKTRHRHFHVKKDFLKSV